MRDSTMDSQSISEEANQRLARRPDDGFGPTSIQQACWRLQTSDGKGTSHKSKYVAAGLAKRHATESSWAEGCNKAIDNALSPGYAVIVAAAVRNWFAPPPNPQSQP